MIFVLQGVACRFSGLRKLIGRGQQARARIDTLLQHYLTIQARDEILVSHLYVAFRDHATAFNAPARTLETIGRYAAM
jgi:hypothetical protein